ncbi:AAA family ATPase [Streptomyces sp. NPDC102405]|uniref:helix-turn-helix transcriptional regulator n=1 Tax=Streptomyces sp. NPDC102405 TaxID=3366170 RepID=UPI0037F35AA9
MTAMRGNAVGVGVLLGRRREQQMLAGLLSGAREGQSAALVVRGEAGIGKTALVTDMQKQASGFRVIRISGAESEMELAYAGVQQVCAPLMALADRLPKPQRNALEVALGLTEGDAPDGLFVGLAVLTLLGEAGSERPTVCVIDDAQWVDHASMQALGFVARRLLAEPVMMVFAIRQPAAELAGLPELLLHGLGDSDARALLAATVPGRLSDRMRENIIEESGGNPLALLELHRALSPTELAGGYGLAEARSTATRVEATFNRQFHNLSSPTRTLLLIAAAEPTGESSWLWRAADRLGIGVEAAAPAEAAGLISTVGRVRFRHPLVRSAIYGNASLSERRQVHEALAHAITDPMAADHRAWHRAHAAAAPDERLADELVLAAGRARARGGAAAAAAFLAYAVDVTPDSNRRAERALQAAQAKLDAGAPDSAAQLLAVAEEAADSESIGARVNLVRAKLAFAASRGRDAPPLLLAAARQLEVIDPGLARETYLEALMSAIIVGRLSAGELSSLPHVADAAKHAPRPTGPPKAVDMLLDGLIVRLTEGHVAAVPTLRSALDEYVREQRAGTADPRWHDITNRVCLDLFDQDTYNMLSARQLEVLRRTASLTLLPVALATQAGVHVQLGEFGQAAALLEEAEVIRTATGAPAQRYIDPFLSAYRGQQQLTLDLVRECIDGATARGEGFAIHVALYAAAILNNGLGHYDEALSNCRSALQYDDIGISLYALTEMVEAAARSGRTPIATDALARLAERAGPITTDSAVGILARSRALAEAGRSAEDEYLTAITHLERSRPQVVYLARTHLVYGEWLRRADRRTDARAELRIAYDMFSQMGAEGFAARAGRELRAAGEKVHPQTTGVTTDLTPQEIHIARLAREGYTNPEIGAQLFISPRTVEWHLGNIFAKLGVSSRRELRRLALELS